MMEIEKKEEHLRYKEKHNRKWRKKVEKKIRRGGRGRKKKRREATTQLDGSR